MRVERTLPGAEDLRTLAAQHPPHHPAAVARAPDNLLDPNKDLSTIAAHKERMRVLAILAIMIGGFVLMDHFAFDGGTRRQVEQATRKTAVDLRGHADTWAEQFSH